MPARPNAPYLEGGGEHSPFMPTGGGGGGLTEAEVIALIEARRSPRGAAGGALAGEYPNPTAAQLAYQALEAINANLAAAGEPWATVTAGAALDPLGWVRCRGAFKPSAEIPAKGILFTLPAACRPEHQRSAVLSLNALATSTNVIVKATGEVELVAAIKTTNVLDLSQLSFAKAG